MHTAEQWHFKHHSIVSQVTLVFIIMESWFWFGGTVGFSLLFNDIVCIGTSWSNMTNKQQSGWIHRILQNITMSIELGLSNVWWYLWSQFTDLHYIVAVTEAGVVIHAGSIRLGHHNKVCKKTVWCIKMYFWLCYCIGTMDGTTTCASNHSLLLVYSEHLYTAHD